MDNRTNLEKHEFFKKQLGKDYLDSPTFAEYPDEWWLDDNFESPPKVEKLEKGLGIRDKSTPCVFTATKDLSVDSSDLIPQSSSSHAELSASGSATWLNCPASRVIQAGYADSTSVYAEEGSCAHHLAEECLKTEDPAIFYNGTVFKEFPKFPVTEEMVDNIQIYLDYVNNLGGNLFVEQRVDYSKWVPKGFGTADAIIMNGEDGENTVVVVDLKYGVHVRVDAENNTQAMLYALGVSNDFDFLGQFEFFKLVIVQPRMDHISEWTITREELLKFAEQAKIKAELTFVKDPIFNPGDKQCRWCKAKDDCTARAEHMLEDIFDDFKDIDSELELKKETLLTLDQRSKILLKVKSIKSWLKSFGGSCLKKALDGGEIPDFKVVESRPNRAWLEETEVETALRKSVLKLDQIFIKTLVSPAQAEKLLGKKSKLVSKFAHTPGGDPTLVHKSDKREPMKLEDEIIDEEFDHIESMHRAATSEHGLND